MTTYPGTADPQSAGVLADGSSISHRDEHGRTIHIWENVMRHGAKADGSTDDSAAFTAAFDAVSPVRGGVYFPPGNYSISSAIAIPDWVKAKGFGRNQTNINFTNAHAFTIASSTSNQWISDLTFTSRSGSTSGSAIKVTSGSSVTIENIAVNGVSTNTDPGVWVNGGVNCHLDRIMVNGGGGHGISMAIGAFFSNANTLYRARVNSLAGAGGDTNAAVYLEGSHNRVRDCIFEANHGYGVYSNGGNWNTVDGVWFEDQANHNVYSVHDLGLEIRHCKFQGIGEGITPVAGARYIKMTEPSASQANHNAILFNTFQDSITPNIEIGSNVEDTIIMGNRNLKDANITDNGTRTVQLFNRDASNILTNRFSGTFDAPLRMKSVSAAAASGGDPSSVESTFSVEDSTSTNYFMVGSRGYPIFRTSDTLTSSDELATKSFAFYYDPATFLLKARIRHSDGTYFTSPVSSIALTNAYTVTNPTTDRGLNVTADTLAQVAQVLGTLLADLKAAGILP